MWFGDLLDMRHYAVGGQDLYVKLAAADVGTSATVYRSCITCLHVLRTHASFSKRNVSIQWADDFDSRDLSSASSASIWLVA